MKALSLLGVAVVGAAFFTGTAVAQDSASQANKEKPSMAQPSSEMQAVLDKLKELGAKPLGTQSVEDTRMGPTPADAAMAVTKEKGIEPDAAFKAVKTKNMMIPGAQDKIAIRIYTPEGVGPFPIVVYYHGGGWVIADIDTYDASARGIAANAKAIVVSADYRHAPEHKFPAAHEDANAAYKWTIESPSGKFSFSLSLLRSTA